MAKANNEYYDLLNEIADIYDDKSQSIAQFAPKVPKDIRMFLGRLSILQDVAYHYLVPDVRLVNVRKENGKEFGALRFFWVDPLWVQSLLSGALSVGEDYDATSLLRDAMEGTYTAEVFQEETIKRLKAQLSGTYAPEDLGKEILKRLNNKQQQQLDSLDEISGATVSQSNWRYTGFLLRSSIVSGLKGLEVTAMGLDTHDSTAQPRKLSVLRLEYIADDTLFCLCEGIITQVEITQPPENLYFGFNVQNETTHYRDIKIGDKEKKITIQKRDNKYRTLRITGDGGVIDELGKATKKTISPKDMAEYLLSMPVKHTVTINWEKAKTNGKNK